jgi:hypothetical protein
MFSGGDDEEEVDDITHLERLLGDQSELMGHTNPLVVPDSSSSEEYDSAMLDYDSDGYEEEYVHIQHIEQPPQEAEPVPDRPVAGENHSA